MQYLFTQIDPFLWSNLLSQYGPLVGVVLFFIWRDWKREDRLNTRIHALEDYQKETLADLVSHSTVALTHSADCMKWIGAILAQLCAKYPKLDECPKPHHHE